MIDGKASEFINKIYYEDHYAIYNGSKYFFNGCQFERSIADVNTIVRLEVYDLTNDTTLFSVTKPSASECVEAFENAPIWGGKNFWDIESQMQWVDE